MASNVRKHVFVVERYLKQNRLKQPSHYSHLFGYPAPEWKLESTQLIAEFEQQTWVLYISCLTLTKTLKLTSQELDIQQLVSPDCDKRH